MSPDKNSLRRPPDPNDLRFLLAGFNPQTGHVDPDIFADALERLSQVQGFEHYQDKPEQLAEDAIKILLSFNFNSLFSP